MISSFSSGLLPIVGLMFRKVKPLACDDLKHLRHSERRQTMAVRKLAQIGFAVAYLSAAIMLSP